MSFRIFICTFSFSTICHWLMATYLATSMCVVLISLSNLTQECCYMDFPACQTVPWNMFVGVSQRTKDLKLCLDVNDNFSRPKQRNGIKNSRQRKRFWFDCSGLCVRVFCHADVVDGGLVTVPQHKEFSILTGIKGNTVQADCERVRHS